MRSDEEVKFRRSARGISPLAAPSSPITPVCSCTSQHSFTAEGGRPCPPQEDERCARHGNRNTKVVLVMTIIAVRGPGLDSDLTNLGPLHQKLHLSRPARTGPITHRLAEQSVSARKEPVCVTTRLMAAQMAVVKHGWQQAHASEPCIARQTPVDGLQSDAAASQFGESVLCFAKSRRPALVSQYPNHW